MYDSIDDLNIFLVKVYFNENSLANVIVFKHVVSIPSARITMNTVSDKSITLYL